MSTALLNTRATQGQRSGSSKDSVVAGEGAEAARSGARSRGAALTQSARTRYARREPEHRWYRGGRTTGVQQDVASGTAGGSIGRQPVTSMRTIP
jgi:hypothetical protein